jgi:hypothetical protein
MSKVGNLKKRSSYYHTDIIGEVPKHVWKKMKKLVLRKAEAREELAELKEPIVVDTNETTGGGR